MAGPAERQQPPGPTSMAPLLALLLVAVSLAYVLAMVFLRPSSPGQELPLSEVLNRSQAKAITEVTLLQEDDRLRGVSSVDPTSFWASVPEELLPGLTDRLVSNGATVKVDNQFAKGTVRFLAQFLLPILILVVLFTLFFVVIRGGAAGVTEFLRFGRVGDPGKRSDEAEKASFRDVGGVGDTVVEMREIGQFLEEPGAYQAMGAEPPRGVLLVGPPGVGKTLLARALAAESDVAFLYLSGAEFVESLVGIGAARVRNLFAQAREARRAIIFIDELDAVGRRRGAGMGMGHDEREQTLNQLLVEMDGFDKYSGIVVIGATNRADILDPALTRPGRFDRRVFLFEPDLEGRREILQIHARGRRMGHDVDLDAIARETPGFTGADLASVVNEAALLAVRRRKDRIGQPELEEALERVLLGPAKRSRLTAEERRRAAYHEAGHAVVARAVGLPVAVQKISIVARGRNLGHHAVTSDGDRVLAGYHLLMRELTITMAGLAGELTVFDDISTASQGDIDNATKLARRLVCLYGMSERIGRLRVGVPEEELFLGRDWHLQGQHSPALLDAVDEEVGRLIRLGEEQAKRLLLAHRRALDALARRLEEVETVRAEEIGAVLAGVAPGPDGQVGGAPS